MTGRVAPPKFPQRLRPRLRRRTGRPRLGRMRLRVIIHLLLTVGVSIVPRYSRPLVHIVDGRVGRLDRAEAREPSVLLRVLEADGYSPRTFSLVGNGEPPLEMVGFMSNETEALDRQSIVSDAGTAEE